MAAARPPTDDPPGMPPGLTPGQRLEWERCAADPAYFAETYCRIFDKASKRWIPFALWAAQREAIATVRGSPRTVILKARQQGFTWLVLCYVSWLMVFRPTQEVLLFSLREEEAKELVGHRLCGIHSRLPPWLGGSADAGARRMVLANGSRALSFPTTGARSYAGTFVLIDEADNIPDLLDLLNAVEPTVDDGGQLVLLSTADKGKPQSAFKNIYRAAAAEGNGYEALFYPWSAHPGRTEEWYAEQVRKHQRSYGTLDNLHQEYPATDTEALAARTLDKRLPAPWVAACYDPLPALNLLGPAHALRHLESSAPALPGLRAYAVPAPGRRYVLGADPAEGNPTSDDSALSVHDADSGAQVAALAGKYDPAVFAGVIRAVAEWYNDAPAMVERNNHGHAVILWLTDNAPRTHVLKGPDGRPGYQTTTASKALLYDESAEVLRQGACAIRDPGTRDQLLAIEGATLRAPAGERDDRAVAFVLAVAAQSAAPRGTLGVF